MAELLKKEFTLFAHPTSWMFLSFGAMMLIPGYPMYVPLFWATLGLFYACLSARENNDLYYTLLLPVRKRDAVRAGAVLRARRAYAGCGLRALRRFARCARRRAERRGHGR